MGLLVAVGIALVASAALALPAVHGAPAAALQPAGGTTTQIAFGGSASAYWSCSQAGCFNGTAPVGTFSLSILYYIGWVVIYTQTNVSSSQTMFEVQTALNATITETIQENSTSASLTLAGSETAAGFTNVTDTGSVDVQSGGPVAPGPVAAAAVMNAASTEAFNFSGAYVFTNGSQSGTLNFDIGANEASSVDFSTPLGLVPLDPQPGESWTSSAPFSASGSWTAGYSISGSYGGYPISNASWTNGAVSPSGTLDVSGSDLGAYTLWDNYTNPPSSVTAQLIALDFDNGTFGASDGWLFVPSGMFVDLFGSDAATEGGLQSLAAGAPAQTDVPSFATGESAYYTPSAGFVGVNAAGSTSNSLVGSGSTGPSISVTAGPEPVSVAQQQYSGITGHSAGGGSSSSPMSWTFVILGVVVAVIVIAVVVLMVQRSRRPPTVSRPVYPGGMAAAGTAPMSGPSGPQPPTGGLEPLSPAAAPAVAPTPTTAPVCPTCGLPSTYIAQYGRYYCYTDRRYL
jgi:hypothetical protein